MIKTLNKRLPLTICDLIIKLSGLKAEKLIKVWMMFYVVGRRCRVFLIKIKLAEKRNINIYIEKKMEAKKATLSCFFIRFVVVAVKAAFNSTLIILWLSVVDHFFSVASAVVAIDLSRSFFLSFVVL